MAYLQHTKEKIIRVRAVSAYPEDLDQVKELSMDVTDDSDRGLNVDDIALTHQQLFCLGAYRFDNRLGKEFLLVEAGDAFVEVDRRYQRLISKQLTKGKCDWCTNLVDLAL
jgi:hypothetical protein